MLLYQTIYSSQPFGYDESILIGILMDARKLNAANGVTGALICRADVYIQLLEGPKAAVLATMERIRRDDRHLNIRVHVGEPATTRIFPRWAMHHDPGTSWHWTQDEVAAGALETAGPEQFRAIFRRIAERVDDPA